MNCKKILGKPSIPFKMKADYAISDSQVYVPAIGTLGRAGMCFVCDAAIYQQERSGKTFPDSLHGRRFHATDAGLVEL
jgi:hypothetical protein